MAASAQCSLEIATPIFYISLGKWSCIQHGRRLSLNLSPQTGWQSEFNGAIVVAELRSKTGSKLTCFYISFRIIKQALLFYFVWLRCLL